jgi:L-amino acid N-acyltransferase YncA
MMTIRQAQSKDFEEIWQIFHEVVSAGDTYPFSPDTDRAEALRLWTEIPRATYVAEHGGEVVGTYYIKTNQPGLGSHVCNAGYMVRSGARGTGVGKAMCAHSLDEARRMGYRAMQYNLVVVTNVAAVQLWQTMGFEAVGTLPQAFNHAALGLVDAHVMYRLL